GRMYDLNSLTDGLNGWLLREALDVTADGWILARAQPAADGPGADFWLKPILDGGPDPGPSSPGTPLEVPIPEPFSAALWLGLAGGAAAWRWTRPVLPARSSVP
ncbi:MAG TPA: hypothetical protein VF590_10490, partial [Isosphaeraceae bacterium]